MEGTNEFWVCPVCGDHRETAVTIDFSNRGTDFVAQKCRMCGYRWIREVKSREMIASMRYSILPEHQADGFLAVVETVQNLKGE